MGRSRLRDSPVLGDKICQEDSILLARPRSRDTLDMHDNFRQMDKAQMVPVVEVQTDLHREGMHGHYLHDLPKVPSGTVRHAQEARAFVP